MKKGFTLVELMIVIAIISILATIAVPNLMQARAQANEANAIAACKAYFSSQILFQRAGFAANEGLGTVSGNQVAANLQPQISAMYAAPYTALYGTNDGSGRPIAFINAGMVAASITNNPNPVVTNAPTQPAAGATSANTLQVTFTSAINLPARAAYQGYVFADDMTRGTTFAAWCAGFGFFATPTNWSNTGYNSFWVGQAGIVYSRNLRRTIDNSGNLMTAARVGATTTTDSLETIISAGSTLWQMTR